MRSLENSLGNWISLRFGDQDGLASKLGITRAAVSAYKTGRNEIPAKVKDAIRKLGYDGPWPRAEAQEATAGASIGYATIEEVAELRGAVKAHIEYWERGEEKVLRRLEDAIRRIEALERRIAP